MCQGEGGVRNEVRWGPSLPPFLLPYGLLRWAGPETPELLWSCLRVDLGQGLQELCWGRREKEATSNSNPVSLPVHFSPLYPDSWASCQLLQRKDPDVTVKGRPWRGCWVTGNICAPLLFVLLKAVNIFSRTWKVLQVKGQEALEKQGQEKKSHQAQIGPVLTGRSPTSTPDCGSE